MCQIFSGQDPDDYAPTTRHLRINGQSTSIRLERPFWDMIDAIAANENLSTPAFLSTLHSEVLYLHGEARNFTSLLRCACLTYLVQNGEPSSNNSTLPPAGRGKLHIASV